MRLPVRRVEGCRRHANDVCQRQRPSFMFCWRLPFPSPQHGEETRATENLQVAPAIARG